MSPQYKPPTPSIATSVQGVKVSAPTVEIPVKPVKNFHVFHNTMKSCNMITDTGSVIAFVGGKFITDLQTEIDYLQKEISLRNPYLYTEAGKEIQTSDELDPMKVLRAKHFEEFAIEQAALAARIAAGKNLTGDTELQKLTPGSTADIANLAAGSDSVNI